MTIRSIIAGLLLGLFISAFAYFNDQVIKQTMLIGNHLPIAVFGVACLLSMVLNPLLRVFGQRWPLRASEVAVLVAVALAACAWPGSNFYRVATAIVVMPNHWHQAEPSWQTANVMSYVPGGSAELASGHVRDWPGLIAALNRARAASQPEPGVTAMVQRLDRAALRLLDEARSADRISAADARTLRQTINRELIRPTSDEAPQPLHAQLASEGVLSDAARAALARADAARAASARHAEQARAEAAEGRVDRGARRLALYWQGQVRHEEQHANRAAMAALLPDWIAPAPAGGGVLLAGGRTDAGVVEPLVSGEAAMRLTEIPWQAWWPTIRLWGGLSLLLAFASLALALVVHPQWSHREMLPYPIARFVAELGDRRAEGYLPNIVSHRLFWFGFAGLMLLHLVNGLHAWFDHVPQVPMRLQFTPMRELFPQASRVWGSAAYFEPQIYPSVIAFTFFLTGVVGFSLGIAHALFMVVGALLIGYGTSFDQDYIGAGKGNLFRFGAYVGFTLIIAYTGRHYYAQLLGRTFGLGRADALPGYAVWAARGLLLSLVLSVAWLHHAGLSWPLGLLFVLTALMIVLVMSRVVAETGAFFLQAYWLPVGVLTALLGVEAIGPTAYVLLAVASIMVVGDPREALMPYLTNALRLGEQASPRRPGRVAPWLGVMIVVGFMVAGAATMLLQHRHGLISADGWARQMLPSMPLRQLAHYTAEMEGRNTLTAAVFDEGASRLAMIRAEPHAVSWTLIGAALVIATAAARLRLAWWPLHPIAFLLAGAGVSRHFAFSFLLGWAIKVAVVRLGGTRAYHHLKPLVVGVIAGELLAGLGWMMVGALYFYFTDQTPVRYAIFPL